MSTPAERSAAARIAAHTRWSREKDRTATPRAGQAGLRRRFAREIDPEGAMPLAELEKRVDNALRAHMGRLSKRGRKSRTAATCGTTQAEVA